MGSRIVKIASHFPHKKITNEDLALEFNDYDFASFEKKVGIKNRYVVEDETGLDLAVEACNKLFKDVESSLIDFIIYCTQSPEYFLPTTACILQDRLGLSKNIGALDYNLGCSGYVYGLAMAKSLINSGAAKNVLLVTAETYSKFLHKKDRSNRSIFGDAATATLISWDEVEHIGNFQFGTDGSGYQKLIVKNGASRFPFDSEVSEKQYGTNNTYTDNHLYMDGPEIFNFTAENIPDFTLETVKANGLEKDDIGQFVLHQANAFMLNFMRKKMKVEKDKFFIDLEDGGNTVSSTIPIALKKYCHNKNNEEKIALIGFGVGLSWAGCVVTI